MKPNQQTGMLSVFRPPLCFELAGKQFFMEFDDGYDRIANFKDRKTLSFGVVGEEKEFPYECLKIADKLYYVNFEDPTMEPRTGITLVVDLQTELVTMALGRIGTNPKFPGIPSISYVFGAIRRADGTISHTRHGYTTELMGKSISWNYGYFDIAHVYATEHYYRITFSPRGLARVYKGRPEMRSSSKMSYVEPGDTYEDYFTPIKIRDRIYLVGIIEDTKARKIGNGNSILVLMNLDEMHDVGRSFGSNREGGTGNNTLGAFGVWVDATEIMSRKSSLFIR
ncbi:MAG: MoaF N-terminal domain-containing protein [Lachnospiraceae bacterium]|nr:MoaF N-terminal domain-containing protein [Lachnospiraceae bacterium]